MNFVEISTSNHVRQTLQVMQIHEVWSSCCCVNGEEKEKEETDQMPTNRVKNV